uniref:Uncharacterized protein n=1 Tax=Piliocolobus tephrosceles TaxID=591936 RepID=A0A8C9IBF7_9PRIM
MYRKLNSVHLTQLSGQFFSLCLFELGDTSHRLGTQDIAAPVTADLKRQRGSHSYLIVSVVVIGPDSFHQLSQSAVYLRVHLCEGDSGAGLPVD